MRYSWGAKGAISQVIGSGAALVEPENAADANGSAPIQAELWLGAHHGSPSQLVDAEVVPGCRDLRDVIAQHPETALGPLAAGLREGEAPQLPFLMKVLAAAQPLSLQAHPKLAEARAGFALENERGVPMDAPNRNYRDASHKPELLIALTETMDALAGFRAQAEVCELVTAIADAAPENLAFQVFTRRVREAESEGAMLELVAWLLSDDPEVAAAVPALDSWLDDAPTSAERCRYPRERRNLARIRAAFPDDAGCLTALLMNHVALKRGEAIYVQAGVLHAYIDGVGIEVMAASDNVLRGGLTPKHIDVPELLRVLRASPTPPPFLAPLNLEHGLQLFKPEEPDFQVQRVCGDDVSVKAHFVGPAILLGLNGPLTVTGASGECVTLNQGDSYFITPEEAPVHIAGAGDCVLASAGIEPGTALPLR